MTPERQEYMRNYVYNYRKTSIGRFHALKDRLKATSNMDTQMPIVKEIIDLYHNDEKVRKYFENL